MKKRIVSALAAILLIPIGLFAAVTATQKVEAVIVDDLYVYELDVTGTTGTVQTTYNVNGYIYLVETDPGTPAPDDNYDLTLTNANGADIMGGSIANRSATATQRSFPLVGTSSAVVPNKGKLTLNVTNNSASGARFKVRIYYMK